MLRQENKEMNSKLKKLEKKKSVKTKYSEQRSRQLKALDSAEKIKATLEDMRKKACEQSKHIQSISRKFNALEDKLAEANAK
jgi:predicted  nucleic acid-binding Zn-ribbon protein